ncbi:MAG: recombinase family protein [Magnetococcales bacterium]|nr:recombinase family protein [Magnetococcales bacterium]
MSTSSKTSRHVIGYIRVSTRDQVDGRSLDVQKDLITQWSRKQVGVLPHIFEDAGITGTRRDLRPGLRRALDMACANKAVLVVYSLSRIARSVKDLFQIFDELQRSKADLISLTEEWDTTTASGRMIFGIMAVLAQFERDLISERTRSALHFKKSKGELIGQAPYGFRADRSRTPAMLVEDEKEQAILKQIQMLANQGETQVEIAHSLNCLGLRTRRGTPWSNVRISQILADRNHTENAP